MLTFVFLFMVISKVWFSWLHPLISGGHACCHHFYSLTLFFTHSTHSVSHVFRHVLLLINMWCFLHFKFRSMVMIYLSCNTSFCPISFIHLNTFHVCSSSIHESYWYSVRLYYIKYTAWINASVYPRSYQLLTTIMSFFYRKGIPNIFLYFGPLSLRDEGIIDVIPLVYPQKMKIN